jgi:hypothetical protein
VLYALEELAEIRRRHVCQRLLVQPRHDQHVPDEQRRAIQEGHDEIVGENDIGWSAAGDDVAEDAVPLAHLDSLAR